LLFAPCADTGRQKATQIFIICQNSKKQDLTRNSSLNIE